ncbi:retinol dehydrogenase 11-like [Tenebrio molitor]|uniref:retinol dehydrogenase 11-like n=1 Tax=Tenebrio molitor TaxID=7067 RepID=UPI003624A747
MVVVSVILATIILCVAIKIYLKVTTRWCESATCLVGKAAIVTGANTGIGYGIALDFAKRGAKVILACRNPDRAEEARLKIIKESGSANVVVTLLDLSSFESVDNFVKTVTECEERLDILVNNAAMIEFDGCRLSKDGYVLIRQVNYFSVFLLTLGLIGLMKRNESSRIVNLSSMMAKFAYNFEVNDLYKFSGTLNNYSVTKLCINLFTIELADRLKQTGISVYSVNPGNVDTDILTGRYTSGPLKIMVKLVMSFFLKTIEEGAQTPIYCAVTKGIEMYSGEHFEECRKVDRYSTVKVPELPKKLWDVTEDILRLQLENMKVKF